MVNTGSCKPTSLCPVAHPQIEGRFWDIATHCSFLHLHLCPLRLAHFSWPPRLRGAPCS